METHISLEKISRPVDFERVYKFYFIMPGLKA